MLCNFFAFRWAIAYLFSEYFVPSTISPASRRQQFRQWYEKHSDKIYDFAAEAKKYCYMDVKILALGVQKLKKTCLALSSGTADIITGKSFTKAGFTMTLFRNKYMIPNSIGIMPSSNYGKAERHNSILALRYLSYLNVQRSCKGEAQIRHAGNHEKGEVSIHVGGAKLHVDGFLGPTSTMRNATVYEIEGVRQIICFFAFSIKPVFILFIVFLARALSVYRGQLSR